MGPSWEKSARQFGERTLYVSFGQFGKQGIGSPLKMRCCPSKGNEILHQLIACLMQLHLLLRCFFKNKGKRCKEKVSINTGKKKMYFQNLFLEFEFLTEAEQVSKLGSILFGGLFLRLEK